MDEKRAARIQSLANREFKHSHNLKLMPLLGEWYRYPDYLEVLLKRYQESCAVGIEAHQDFQRRHHAESITERLQPEEEFPAYLRQYRLMQVVFMDIEAIYIFAKILLDRIADVFKFLLKMKFGSGSSHSQLCSRFESFCLNQGAVMVPPELPATMARLKKIVTEHRNTWIEHADGRGIQRSMILAGDFIEVSLKEMSVKVEQARTANLDQLLLDLASYIDAVLTFFEANLQ
jgi:hypothetical protein